MATSCMPQVTEISRVAVATLNVAGCPRHAEPHANAKQDEDVVLDKDEDRMKQTSFAAHKGNDVNASNRIDFIEISSEDEDENSGISSCTPKRRNNQRTTARARRIVQSSDSERSDDELWEPKPVLRPCTDRVLVKPSGPVIDLTLSSSESSEDNTREIKTMTKHKTPTSSNIVPTHRQRHIGYSEVLPKPLPLYVDDDDSITSAENDQPFLVLDAPDGAHKAGPLLNESVPHSNLDNVPPASHSHPRRIGSYKSSSDCDVGVSPAKRTPAATPRKAGKAPRMTQKAMRDAEQARREGFARALFEDLNRTIFGGKIPATTQLTWNKRLLTTAGRARWHKSNDSVQKYEIELATKILDCDERIRNTLSHEMCHLACWIIDADPKEHHGRKFKAWARKVMRKRPDIEVTTKHNYDIACKYQWKCEQCNRIYGRHSKSMRANAVCGRCNAGRLIPLFENTRRAPRMPIIKTETHLPSTQSSASPRSGPLPTGSQDGVGLSGIPIRLPSRPILDSKKPVIVVESSDEEDSEVEVIAHVFGSIIIFREADV